jgi:hypothetical protein
VKELLTKLVFQSLHGTCQAGGCDVAGLAGFTEVQGPGQVAKKLEFSYIH